MFLLDTNVISEFRKIGSTRVNTNVLKWANSVSASHLFLSTTTIMELELGILLIERRDAAQSAILRSWLDSHVLPHFSDRILDFDTAIAKQCAKLNVPDPRPDRDAMIAATALVHGMTVVTRNMRDFETMGVNLLDPWTHQT